MHPAPSVILFTVLSGLGFGFLAYLNAGAIAPAGVGAFAAFGLGYLLAVGGLLASSFHLGQPKRALLAFTQWRSSWLSREAWVSCAALLGTAPVALRAMGGGAPGVWGGVAALLCVGAVFCTSMIYAQLATVPRWNHWIVPVTFLGFALTGGAILSVQGGLAAGLSGVLAVLLVLGFWVGDAQFGLKGATLGTATGLGVIGVPRVFEQGHTGGNYLLREMIHLVGRKHAVKLRVIAVAGVALPVAVFLLLPAGLVSMALALSAHLVGAFVSRWLFFAEAEHVVGLYYGKR